MKQPTITCLCGSTRFYSTYQEANFQETMAGRIVLSVGFYPHGDLEHHGQGVGVTPEQKRALDELHLRKIDLADEILVLNVGGYVGDSTCGEIRYAVQAGKRIRYWEPDAAPAQRDDWGNPVFLDLEDGYWYFWDETQSHKYGPFDTVAIADAACTEYSNNL